MEPSKAVALRAADLELEPPALVQVAWASTRLQLFAPRLLRRLSLLEDLRPQDMALGAWVLAFWHFVGRFHGS